MVALVLAAAVAGFVPQLQQGDQLPTFFVHDQTGRSVTLGAGSGRVTILSFFYVSCPDPTVCSNMSGKFAWMQAHLTRTERIALVELTLDPQHDDTPALNRYARAFGANAKLWHLATAKKKDVDDLALRFGIARQRVNRLRLLHTEAVAVLNTDGTLRTLLVSSNSNPADILQNAREANGERTSWLQQSLYWLGQNVGALCGRSNAATSITVGVFLGGLTLACLCSTRLLLQLLKQR